MKIRSFTALLNYWMQSLYLRSEKNKLKIVLYAFVHDSGSEEETLQHFSYNDIRGFFSPLANYTDRAIAAGQRR
jgi:hypothetical protein